MRIVLMGTGNTATVLGRLMKKCGHELLQVYGRTSSSASALASELETNFVSTPGDITDGADIYIIAVSDNAIANLAGELKLGNHLLVHTAGAVSKRVLQKASRNYGVLYPLQSLRKEMDDIPPIPFLVDGNTSEDLTLLYDFAKSISNQVAKADDELRLHYHLAAVLSNNFSNHLYTLAEEYCKAKQADFRLLLPLIQQLCLRMNRYSPSALQTGPALRGDSATIELHLKLLEHMPGIKNLYTSITKSIQDHYRRTDN
jgi:predicted short-subunit dehydrogenase-like oxidoreductase (DUF2520 family)